MYNGGGVMIMHNNGFCSKRRHDHAQQRVLIQAVPRDDTKIKDQQQLTEVSDIAGNVKEAKQLVKKIKAKLKNGEELRYISNLGLIVENAALLSFRAVRSVGPEPDFCNICLRFNSLSNVADKYHLHQPRRTANEP
ncbi:hypothetical protein ACHAWF_017271 [Thalassiosira exigua]